MSIDPVVNFGKVSLLQGYDGAAVSVSLVAGHGARLPNPGTDGAFNIVWWNSTDYGDPTDDPNREIVRCTARATDTLTISRAQEGSTASTKNNDGKTYQMVLAVTQKTINDLKNAIPVLPTWKKDTVANGGITGAIDGVNVTYTISQIPIASSGTLMLNGQPMTEGVDYTVSLSLKHIVMTTPIPAVASSLPFEFKYQY